MPDSVSVLATYFLMDHQSRRLTFTVGAVIIHSSRSVGLPTLDHSWFVWNFAVDIALLKNPELEIFSDA